MHGLNWPSQLNSASAGQWEAHRGIIITYFLKYIITIISGPTGQEMLGFWQAFQKLRMDGRTNGMPLYVYR